MRQHIWYKGNTNISWRKKIMVLGFGKWVAKKGGKKVTETITKVKPVTRG